MKSFNSQTKYSFWPNGPKQVMIWSFISQLLNLYRQFISIRKGLKKVWKIVGQNPQKNKKPKNVNLILIAKATSSLLLISLKKAAFEILSCSLYPPLTVSLKLDMIMLFMNICINNTFSPNLDCTALIRYPLLLPMNLIHKPSEFHTICISFFQFTA